MQTELAIDYWIETLEAEGRSDATIRTYRALTRGLSAAMPELDADATLALRRHLAVYRKDHAAASLRSVFVTWRAFVNWCVSEGLLTRSPLAGTRVPQVPETFRDAYTRGQMLTLFAYLRGVRTPIGLRNLAVCSLLLDCGLRAGEICRLTVDDIADGDLIIRRTKSLRPRVVPMSKRSASTMARYLSFGRPALRPITNDLFLNQYGRGLNRWGLAGILDRVGEAAGFHVNAHRFRHTAATEWLRAGLSLELVRRLGGWSDTEMLTRVYAHLNTADLREAQERASPLGRLS